MEGFDCEIAKHGRKKFIFTKIMRKIYVTKNGANLINFPGCKNT